MIRARLLALALATGGALSRAGSLQAQADTTRRDTTAAADTTKRDTLPALLPVIAPNIAPGPLPAGMRYTFTVDSMLLTSARTLSDLLSHIPGVYIVRGGWYGQPELVLYAGRGPASLEVYWDGVPYLPLGRDSLYLDPARIPLAPLERIDVMMLPGALQVYLVTARPRSTATGTQVGILTGNQDIAEYRGGYSTRTRSGFGAAVLADWSSIGAGLSNSSTTPFGTSDIWLKFDYVPPGGLVGASFQILSSSWHRAAGGNGLVPAWRQNRRERQLRLFIADRGDGLGYRLTTTLATSELSNDTATANRSVSTAIIEGSRTWRHATIVASARAGAARLPQQLEARGGWTASWITLSGGIRQSFYDGHRAGIRGYAAAGLTLPFGFSARAEASMLHDVQSAFIVSDSAQNANDFAAWIRFDHRRLTLEVGRGRRDPFAPLGFAAGITPIDSLRPTEATQFLAAHGSFEILPGLRISGWYYDPVVGGGDFEPPHHSRLSLAFYSKFWRVFKSGIFALRAEAAVESWSRSPLGGVFVDSTGATVTHAMNGASFVDTDLQMQLAGVTLFWTTQNLNLMRASYLAGLGFPRPAQQYGARWFFTN